MATLNLKKKKFIDEDALKKIVAIGINFGERLNSIETSLIAEYDSTKTYIIGEACYHDNYIYKCKSTATGEWNPDRWQLIGDDITELTLDEIKAMLGLTTEQLTTLSSIILDSEVRLDKTYSSSKIYTSIQNAIDTAKAYTLAEIGKASGASYKIASSTSDMTDEKVIYLLQNGSTYDMYIVDGGTATRIGDVSIDLSDYYTKTEINNDFLKKTDATSTYATKTEANDKVDKSSILTTISSTPSDEKLLSEKAINDTLVKKTDITTTIDNTSTDSEVPSARATYESKKSSIVGLECPVDKSPLEFAIENNKVGQILYFYSWENRHTDTIYAFSTYISIGHLDSRDISLISIAGGSNSYAVNKFHNGTWLGWERISKSKIADIDKTAIELTDTTYFEQFDTAVENGYQVKNGICYVNLNIKCNSTIINGLSIKFGMPKPNFSIVHGTITPFAPGGTGFKKELTFSINSNGVMALFGGEPGCRYLGTFSYPIAES